MINKAYNGASKFVEMTTSLFEDEQDLMFQMDHIKDYTPVYDYTFYPHV